MLCRLMRMCKVMDGGGYTVATKTTAKEAATLRMPTPKAAMNHGSKKGESG